jgi:hypothetical protein
MRSADNKFDINNIISFSVDYFTSCFFDSHSIVTCRLEYQSNIASTDGPFSQVHDYLREPTVAMSIAPIVTASIYFHECGLCLSKIRKVSTSWWGSVS